MCEVAERIYAQGETKGRTQEAKESTQRMYRKGYGVSDIADNLNKTEQQIKIWLGLVAV